MEYNIFYKKYILTVPRVEIKYNIFYKKYIFNNATGRWDTIFLVKIYFYFIAGGRGGACSSR